MHKFIPKYLKVLQIEMDDLKSDIEFLMKQYKQKRKNEEITDYVLLENLAVLKNQIFGISSFSQIVDSINPDNYDGIDDFINDIKTRFKKRMEDCSLGLGIYPLIERKIVKVYKYIQQSD